MVKISTMQVFVILGTVFYVLADPDAAPVPSPAGEPGRNKGSGVKPVISRNPRDKIVIRGKSERLECNAEGYPTPSISWLKDGLPLKPNNQHFALPNGELMFYDFKSSEEGTYVCVARNSAGVARSSNATLQVAYIKEDFRTIPEDTVAAVGGTAELMCDGPRGLPEPKISWKKDKQSLRIGGRIRVERGRLVITGATKADSGYYVCFATNKAGSRESVSVFLAVHEPPSFTVRPQDTTVNEGGELELPCEASGDPKPRIRWTKPIGVDSSRVDFVSTGNLRISNVQPSDEGEYICRAESIATTIEAPASVTVNRNPQFVRRPTNQTVRVGSTVAIPCWADGKPEPSISWRALDGTSIFPGHVFKDSRISVKQNGDLTIENVQFSDQGEYQCQVYHTTGRLFANARLTVMSRERNINPPVLRQVPANVTVAQGATVELKCSSAAVPVPEFRWSKQGSGDIKPGTRFVITSSGSLKISNAQYGDTGEYKCIATNEFGWSEWDTRMKVVAKGSQSVTLKTDPSDLPGAPTTPVFINSTATSVSVKWTANSRVGKSPVTGYILEYYCLQSDVSTWMRVDGVISSTVYTVKNLKQSSQSVFLVRAVNSYGTSNPSEVSEPFSTLGSHLSPTSDTELSQVVIREISATPLSSVTSSGDVGIRLEWMSSANCEFIQGFKIYLQPVSIIRGVPRVVDAPCYAGKSDISHLKSRVIYEIRIHPYKGDDTGRPSPIILASPESEGSNPTPPVLKTEPKAVDDGDAYGSVVFTWDSPESIMPEYITGYTLRCQDKDNGAAYDVTRRLNGGVKTITLEDLPTGRDYVAYVSFTTTLGEGIQSDGVDFSIQASSPPSASPNDGLSGIMSNPGVLAGIAACVVLVIAIIVGVMLYRRHKRNKKGRGLHGRSGMPLDPYNQSYSKGFSMTFVDPRNGNYSDGTGSSAGNANGHIFMQSGGRKPSSAARSTTVSLNNGNGNVGTSLSPEMRPTVRQGSSFSYVADQLTSMSNIPPQFSSPNLERNPNQPITASDIQLQLQQQQYQRQISENPTIAADEMSPQRDLIDMNTPTAENRVEYYARENELPPPPPSPPMSQKTSLSDRTNRSRGSSRNSAERGSNHSSKGRRSRERNRGYQAIERVATDTDTGIDSPQQTPSPPRPSDLRGEHPSNSQQRGNAGYLYNGKQLSGRRRNDGIAVEYPRSGDPSLGYLGGPSEGETESEIGGVRNPRPSYIPHPEEVRNSVAASSVSMMNRYDSESSERSPSPASSVESLNMESASQVGVNAPQNMLPQMLANSAFVPIQAQNTHHAGGNRGAFAKPKVPKKNYKDPSAIVNGHYSNNHSPHATQEQFINRIHSASSSGSSYHNTADSGMSAGHGSYGHNSLNSSSSAESGSRSQMSRSRTTGSLSADNHPNQVENSHQFASVDRRQTENLEYQQPRGRYPVSHHENGPMVGHGSKSPQRKNSQDSNLSLPPHNGSPYISYETSELSDRQPMLRDQDFRTQNNDHMPEESRTSFVAAKFGAGKAACGRQPGLSDLPEVSTSDFYSDRSQ